MNAREQVAARAAKIARSGNPTRCFTIPGPLLGYRASLRACFDPRYKAFKQQVRILATKAGIPLDLGKNDIACVEVEINWKRRARIDRKNVLGAIEDGLFARDRRVLRGGCNAYENAGVECANVRFRLETA